ncbi:MAG: 50S ribosomal protein L37ae [Thermoplasmata archaeon]
MTRRTKKVGSSGTYGARYGVKIRNLIADIKKQKISVYNCPTCNYASMKRISTGIWECRHCGAKIAGGAYTPTTKVSKAEIKSEKEEDVGGEEKDE